MRPQRPIFRRVETRATPGIVMVAAAWSLSALLCVASALAGFALPMGASTAAPDTPEIIANPVAPPPPKTAAAHAGTASAPAAVKRLRVATYNVRNYNLELRSVDGRVALDYPKPEAEKTALRLVLRVADADVLALQETGGEPFVRELLRDLRREGLDYPHLAVLDGPDPKRRLAFISKVPLRVHAAVPRLPVRGVADVESVSRGLLGVTVATPSGPLSCYAVHLKSRLTRTAADPQAARQRLAEARAIYEHIAHVENFAAGENVTESVPLADAPAAGERVETKPAATPATEPADAPAITAAASAAMPVAVPRVLVLGDFNDDPDSPPLAEFVGSRRRAARHFALIPAADSRGETWTSNYARRDSYSRSDYILATASARRHVRAPVAVIADPPAALTASDHRLVWLDIEFP